MAAEMEGYGFLTAVHANDEVRAIVVRGISDLLDDKEESGRNGGQRTASRNASAFAFEILANLDIDRDETLKTLREQRPNIHSLLPTFGSIGEALNADDPDWLYTLTANDRMNRLSIEPRVPGAPVKRPMTVKFHTDLPEKVTLEDLLVHVRETQESVVLGPQHAKGMQAFLGDKTLVEYMQPGTLILETQPLGPPVLSKLCLSDSAIGLENLQMEAFHLGERRFKFTNRRDNSAPIIVEIEFTFTEDEISALQAGRAEAASQGSFSIKGNVKPGHTLRQALPLYDFLGKFAESQTVFLRDQRTGVVNHEIEGAHLDYSLPTHLTQLVADLKTIQETWPSHAFLFPVNPTIKEANFLYQVASAVRTGSADVTVTAPTVEVLSKNMPEVVASLPADGTLDSLIVDGTETVTFLGQTVDLGPFDVYLPPVRLVLPAQELLRQASQRDPEDTISVQFDLLETDSNLGVKVYRRFPKTPKASK